MSPKKREGVGLSLTLVDGRSPTEMTPWMKVVVINPVKDYYVFADLQRIAGDDFE